MVRAFVTPKALSEASALPYDDNIQNGDTDSNVAVLQKMLFNSDFKIKVDGEFGPGTEEIIKQFQQKHNLAVTGIVTPELLGSIQEEASLPSRKKNSPPVLTFAKAIAEMQ